MCLFSREFGSKIISIKSLVKSMGSLLEDRDKNVREEAKKMVIEMYRWVGTALKPQLTSLKPIQVGVAFYNFSVSLTFMYSLFSYGIVLVPELSNHIY